MRACDVTQAMHALVMTYFVSGRRNGRVETEVQRVGDDDYDAFLCVRRDLLCKKKRFRSEMNV